MAAKCTCWSVPHAVGCVPLSRVVSARDVSWPDSNNFHDLGLLSSRGPGDTHSGVVSSHGAAEEERKRETVFHRTHKGVEAGKFCLWEPPGGAVLDLSFLPHPDFQAMFSHSPLSGSAPWRTDNSLACVFLMLPAQRVAPGPHAGSRLRQSLSGCSRSGR